MEYFVLVLLTFASAFAIIKLIGFLNKSSRKKIIYRQSDMHNMIKDFLPDYFEPRKPASQMRKHHKKDMIKIISLDDKAYWISDNIFYVADLYYGKPNLDTAKPVDTSNMSKQDIDKMLFILDNLRRGINNDSSSSGN